MTDLRGSSAGWRTAAVVAPAAAAAFALATGWALEHEPAPDTTATSSPAVKPATVSPNPADAIAQRRATAAQARVVHLKRALKRLRANTEAVLSAPIPGAGGGSAGTYSGGSAAVAPSGGGGGGGGTVAAPPVAAAPAPVPAPATNTSTGAS